jgi:hypothetical protein
MDDDSIADLLRCANIALAAINLAHQELGFLEDEGTPKQVAKLRLLKNFVHGAAPPLLELIEKRSATQCSRSSQIDGQLN